MTDLTLRRIKNILQETGRQIEINNYDDARVLLLSGQRNLHRLRVLINATLFDILDNTIIQLLDVCNTEQQPYSNSDRYVPERMTNAGKGRPYVNITRQQILLLLSEGYSASKMANLFGCSRSLVYKVCYREGIKLRDRYSAIGDDALRRQIYVLQQNYPNSGSEMMHGYLKRYGLTIQRKRIRQLLSEIDPVGTARRWSRTVQRRSYRVPTPNSLWHIDAHLKLVRWGFVTHGCIDGYSRLITYLTCTTSITADTVIKLFTNAVTKYGLPSRVRSDHGYENLLVAVLMNTVRGLHRGSHITGRSVHNQRIERLWKDVFNQVISLFQNEFYKLEDEGKLDPNNNIHKFALQTVYLKEINRKLKTLMEAWNMHKIRTEQRRSPRQLWIDGMLQNINSNHTSTEEIFSEQTDIETRLKEAFIRHGINLAEIPLDDVPDVSLLTARVTMSDNQQEMIRNELNNNNVLSEQYVRCVNILLDNISTAM